MPEHLTKRRSLRVLCLTLGALAATTALGAEKTTYFHFDAQGSPVAATNEAGNVIWREEYRPFGARIRNEPPAETNTRWYTGHPQDADTGLTYMGARYYDPLVGRFMAVDPKGFSEDNIHSFNRYAYANNNPYKYIDPDGEFPIVPIILWGVGAGLALHDMLKPVELDAFGDAPLVSIDTYPGPLGAGKRVVKGVDNIGDVADRVTKKTTSSGIGVTRHGLNQKINRQVRSADELDAIKNPLDTRPVKVDELGRPSQRVVGRKTEVVRNPDTGRIVSVNPTSTKKAERLLRRQGFLDE